MRDKRLNRKKDKVQGLLEELNNIEATEENEKIRGKLQSKVDKLQAQIAEIDSEPSTEE
ncbi:hypothetical protein ACOSZF_20320 [Cytobacillus firmus]|uniref:Uncharacterized protein n=1 Tax=Cytobacillus firmus TaxID=1399 RepID=A0A380XXX1_CYTFI|nr:hypothetical protein [Cytobacillus firmus]KAF0822554.1 hypothetical protein KIS1582_3701 [Cytobacillus firmus]MDD9311733.1 hypothetical protein [Cytobacillus firmus]MEC1894065.1 hypothetical protein [Cytobacillus firmus]MED1908742.1 hypothetical protein [Cytobacillus firmus]MED1939503.1 hypothetical protein [Cytobacillus firmus]